jgi:hypothetical protein
MSCPLACPWSTHGYPDDTWAKFGSDGPGNLRAMRLMLGIWVGVIVSGVVYFTIVGLSHG